MSVRLELLAAAGMRPRKDADEKTVAKQCLEKISELSDRDYRAAVKSKEAQKWVSEATAAYNESDGKTVPPLPSDSDEKKVTAKSTQATAKKVSAKKAPAKKVAAKKEAEKPASRKATTKGIQKLAAEVPAPRAPGDSRRYSQVSTSDYIRGICWDFLLKNDRASVPTVMDIIIRKKLPEISEQQVRTVTYETNRVLQIGIEKGLVKLPKIG